MRLLFSFVLLLALAACESAETADPGGAATGAVEREAVDEPRLSYIEVDGIRLRIAEQGEGPLVLFLHGWPESWYSWRRQLSAVAAAGYRGVAPDMRGFGGSDAPESVEDYDVLDLVGDAVGLLDALGEETAVLVGHDWGAAVAWSAVLLHPERFTGLVAMSVPYGGRSAGPPLPAWRERFGDNFFYVLYFQEPGVAEAEFDADPRGILSRVFTSPDTPLEPPLISDPKAGAGGWIGRLGAPKASPPWMPPEDLDYYVAEFTRAGFRGGLNYYRNFDRNWELTPHLEGRQVEVPVLFLAGEKDLVVAGRDRATLEAMMRPVAPDLRDVVLYPDCGHWVQQERAGEVDARLLEFLASLDG